MPLGSVLYRMLLNDYLCFFFTGAQPVGGGVGAGWRERGGGKAVGPVQSSSGRLSLKDRYMFY